MATTSLISLVGLLDKVKNMVISDHIQALVSHTHSAPPTVNLSLCSGGVLTGFCPQGKLAPPPSSTSG